MEIEELNRVHGIKGQLEFIPGKGEFVFVTIRNLSARALISLYGAQVLSFRPLDGPDDLLFVSNKAYFSQGKAIRGGIPLCWPWFGPDPENLNRPNHGFARTESWSVLRAEAVSEFETRLELSLKPTPESRAIWPHDFELTLDVAVGRELTLELKTRNVSRTPFVLTQAFHPYCKIGRIDQVRVLGLDNSPYIDVLARNEKNIQRGPIHCNDEIERIYWSGRREIAIEDRLLKRRIRMDSADSGQTVIWNPWIVKSAAMPDLNPDDYRGFLCIEPGHVANGTVEVQPGGECRLSARFSLCGD